MVNKKKAIIKDNIEKMHDSYHLQLFNTLKSDENLNYTENSNGIFINLSPLL